MTQFDRIVDRRGTSATKWDALTHEFGNADALPMWVADMDFPAPLPVQEAIKRRAAHGFYGYTSEPDAYRPTVVGWLARRHGWNPPPEALVPINGVVPGLALAIAAFTAPGDRVLVFPPVYPPFYRVTEGQGRTVVESPLRFDGHRYEIDWDPLADLLQHTPVKAAIFCSPHNPVGRVWTMEEVERLGTLLINHGVFVLSDEIHGDLVYPGFRHIPFASVSDAFSRQSMTFVAPSKTFGLPGLQTAVAIIPDAARRAQYLRVQRVFGGGEFNPFGLEALLAAYREGDAWLDALIAYLATTREYTLKVFAEEIPAIRAIPPEGTYMIWLDCRALGLDDRALPGFFTHRANVALTDGKAFGTGGQGFQRMNLAMPRALVTEGLGRIREAVKLLARS
jgi:cystathionine beta-lyase